MEVSSAGTANDAECPLSGDLIEWADEILVMERRQAQQLRKRFGPFLRNKRLVCLGIADIYEFMQPDLIELLHAKVPPMLR